MLKKIISLAMTAAIAAACVPLAFAAETMRKHEETMLPAADASRQFKNNAETTAYDGNSETLWVRKNGSEIGIAYISFDLSKAQYAVSEDSLDKVVFSYTVAAKYTNATTQLIQGRYTDIYFDIDENDYTLAKENAYLTQMHKQLCTCTSTDRFHMASRPSMVWQRNGQQLSNGATYDVDITTQVKNSLKAGKSKFTVIIHGNISSGQDSGQVMIASKENSDEAKRPKLTISTSERIPTAMTVAGTVTDDTQLEGSSVLGTKTDMVTKNTNRGIIIKYDISSLMPYKGYIKSAPISVYAQSAKTDARAINIYENSDLNWSETDCTAKSLLGEKPYNLSNMQTLGFSQKEIAQISVSSKGSYAKYEYDIASYIIKLLDEGKTSFTLLFWGVNGGENDQVTIASKENDNAAYRPQLTAEIGVSNVLDPEWSIWANTTGVEIPEPAIAPGYDLNVFYKRADSTGDYDGMETFTVENKNADGRFVVGGLDTDTEYTFLIVPSYNDTPYEVFAPKNVTVAADASFAMTADIPALTNEMTTASVAYSYTRGNSAKDAAILVAAAYAADGTLTNVKVENVKNIPIGGGSKTLALDVSGAAEIKAFGWYEDMSPIMK